MTTIRGVLDRVLVRLPLGLGNTFWKYSVIFAWVGLVYTIIATLYELMVFNHLISLLVRQFEAIAAYLRGFDAILHNLSRGWDLITDPLVAWINRLDVPYIEYVSRFSVVATLLVPSALRYAGFKITHRRDSRDYETIDTQIGQARAELEAAGSSGGGADAGGGSVIGAILGGLLGSVAGPAGIAAGAAIGAMIGSAGDGAASGGAGATGGERARAALAALLPIQESAAERKAKSGRRLQQSVALLRFSAVTAVLLGAAIVADILLYDARNRCFTVRPVGESCVCVTAPDRTGEAVRASGAAPSIPDRLETRGFQNVCVLSDS